VQAFIKFMFLARIYDTVGFVILTMDRLIQSLKGFVAFALCFNILFATLFCILEADVGSEYDEVWGPIKWMTFAFRNALHDFQISKDNGFLPEHVEQD